MLKKICFTSIICGLTYGANAASLNVAVASNFTQPMKLLAQQFEQQTGDSLIISYAATGTLANQIKNGAPFAVFLAADDTTPNQLVEAKLAIEKTQFTYATGRLVLWSKDPRQIESDGELTLKQNRYKHLAIANPKLAPYGKVAYEALGKMNLWQQVESKIVMGDNISSTYQYVVSGNAELGLVALSQVSVQGKIATGSAWIVPENLAPVIKQNAIILDKGAKNPVASKFMNYLHSAAAQKIIQQFGYQ